MTLEYPIKRKSFRTSVTGQAETHLSLALVAAEGEGEGLAFQELRPSLVPCCDRLQSQGCRQ